jgi:hypothetical protein
MSTRSTSRQLEAQTGSAERGNMVVAPSNGDGSFTIESITGTDIPGLVALGGFENNDNLISPARRKSTLNGSCLLQTRETRTAPLTSRRMGQADIRSPISTAMATAQRCLFHVGRPTAAGDQSRAVEPGSAGTGLLGVGCGQETNLFSSTRRLRRRDDLLNSGLHGSDPVVPKRCLLTRS